jgi:hypothetical protein
MSGDDSVLKRSERTQRGSLGSGLTSRARERRASPNEQAPTGSYGCPAEDAALPDFGAVPLAVANSARKISDYRA